MSALLRFALSRVAFVRLISLRFAQTRSMPAKFAPLRSSGSVVERVWRERSHVASQPWATKRMCSGLATVTFWHTKLRQLKAGQWKSPEGATAGRRCRSVGPVPEGAMSRAVAGFQPLLQVVADYTRLSAALIAGCAGRRRASRLQYPGVARNWCHAGGTMRIGGATLATFGVALSFHAGQGTSVCENSDEASPRWGSLRGAVDPPSLEFRAGDSSVRGLPSNAG